MDYSNEKLIEHLKNHQIKPSNIRIKVLNYLLNNRVHPTVEDIYKNILKEIPTLSKTSIYNTLDLFLEKGVVRVLALQEKELRYDVDTSLHGHFKCEQCEKVYDFPLPRNVLERDILDGFVVKNKNIHLYGICKECNK